MPLEEAQLYFNHAATASAASKSWSPDPDAVDELYARYRAGSRPDGTHPHLAGYELQPVRRARSRTQCDVPDPHLIILVAALNIVSGLIMLVKDKGGDIAILRTMGATRGAVMRVFLIAGASIGISGTILGFAIGVLFCQNIEAIRQFLSSLTGTQLFNPEIYFLSKMPAEMDAGEVSPSSSCRSRCRCSPRSIRAGARPGSILSRRCAMSDTAAPPRPHHPHLQGRRGHARSLPRMSALRFNLANWLRWSAHRARANPRCCISRGSSKPRRAAKSSSATKLPRHFPMPSARACAAIPSASSIRLTTCYRNSTRWKTWCSRN